MLLDLRYQVIIRPFAKINRTGKMPIPQELFFLVGWAEEPVPSIDEKDFWKRSIESFELTKNFLMVQSPGFIRGINPKSKIENPQAPAFIRGVASKI